MNLFRNKPRICRDCSGTGIKMILASEGKIENNKLEAKQAYTLCPRCRGTGVLSKELDKYTLKELTTFIPGKTKEQIIELIEAGKLPPKT